MKETTCSLAGHSVRRHSLHFRCSILFGVCQQGVSLFSCPTHCAFRVSGSLNRGVDDVVFFTSVSTKTS
jgi:hypothetical protein